MLLINKNAQRKLIGYSSIYLDCLRLCCALLVVAGHCRQIITPGWKVNGIFLLGHGAVVIFFVLSGYVIAHTTSVKHRNFKTYIVARYARLYSVYVPALIFTAACALLLFCINRTLFLQYDRGNNTIRYLLTLFFSNEFWFTSVAPPLNGPFWSLSFEFWYYTLFAILFYKLPGKKGVALIIVICLLIGPKILLMFPVWGLGWLAYKFKPLAIRITTARALSLNFLLLAFIAAAFLPEFPGRIGYQPLYMANGFLSDLVTGVFVAISVYLLPSNKEAATSDSGLLKQLRYYANLTYPIYLLHFPVLVVCSSIIFRYHLSEPVNYIVGFIAASSVSILLGSFFEKHKGIWYNFFNNLVFNKRLAFSHRKILIETSHS